VTTNSTNPILEFINVSRIYAGQDQANGSVAAVDHISFKLFVGDFTALVGPSGSGKSTLLNLASGLDQPTEGEVLIAGLNLSKMNQAESCELRKRRIGFVFQAYNLFPVLNAVENVEFTSLIRGDDPKEARNRAIEALRVVGLIDKLNSTPAQLSGGQQQRVAVARALATQPDIIFADEPTANLDSKNAIQLIELFEKINQELKATFFFSTHDQRLVDRVKTAIEIRDGRILRVTPKWSSRELSENL
jgi:putative ABC transport system ATP-binding protein